MHNLRRLGGGAGIIAGIAAAWHFLGAAVIIPQAHLSLSAQESPHKYLVWANKHQEMLWWISGGGLLAPLLCRVVLLALADRLREDAPDRSQIGLTLGVLGMTAFAVGAFLKHFGLGSLVPFHVTNKVGAAIAFYAVNGTANAFVSLGGAALGFAALVFRSVMLKMRGYYGQAGSLSVRAAARWSVSPSRPDGRWRAIRSAVGRCPLRSAAASEATTGWDATAPRTMRASSTVPSGACRSAAATPRTGKSNEPRRRSFQ